MIHPSCQHSMVATAQKHLIRRLMFFNKKVLLSPCYKSSFLIHWRLLNTGRTYSIMIRFCVSKSEDQKTKLWSNSISGHLTLRNQPQLTIILLNFLRYAFWKKLCRTHMTVCIHFLFHILIFFFNSYWNSYWWNVRYQQKTTLKPWSIQMNCHMSKWAIMKLGVVNQIFQVPGTVYIYLGKCNIPPSSEWSLWWVPERKSLFNYVFFIDAHYFFPQFQTFWRKWQELPLKN